MAKKQPMSQDPKVRADRVNANAVYLKPSLYKILCDVQEMLHNEHLARTGKKFVSSRDKQANFADEVSKDV
tara:strand:+ start:361 stop:573 length:213 start_codon:yes stop_codon:yes gene_type:complete